MMAMRAASSLQDGACLSHIISNRHLHRYSSADGSSSYLATWNGHVWTSQGPSFGGSSVVSQLAMVPLQNEYQARGVIEGDRMLLMSGNLVDMSFGPTSAVLFDGQDFIPYIISSTSSGDPGSVSGLFNSLANFSFAHRSEPCRVFIFLTPTLIVNRFPGYWRGHSDLHRHRRGHCLLPRSARNFLDAVFPSGRGSQQVRPRGYW